MNSQGGEYGNPLQAASYGGHLEFVHVLLERRADINAQRRMLRECPQGSFSHQEATTKPDQILLEWELRSWKI